MLEKPDLSDALLIAALRDEFALNVTRLTFLPIGADRNTFVYRVDALDTTYFVKLRAEDFQPVSVELPRLLYDQGVTQVIAPLHTRAGQLWSHVEHFTLVVYPFVEGQDGFTVNLSDQHWIEFGLALRGLHSATLPADLLSRIPRETYPDMWRNQVRAYQGRAASETFADPAAAGLAALLRQRDDEINTLVRQAERLGEILRSRADVFVVCHADIHAGNLLIDSAGGLHMVDWDTLILAPRERDLMFVGGGLGGDGHTPDEEIALFYQGYGQTEADSLALAYYRCERIVQDIAAYCLEILDMTVGAEDRARGLHQLSAQFEPGNVVELAFHSIQHGGG